MEKTESRELVPQTKYHRGAILLTIQTLSTDKDQAQPQLYDLVRYVENNDNVLLLIIIGKLNPEWRRSFNLLMDFATAIDKYDQTIAEAALHKIECLSNWRERKDAFQRIVDVRPIEDGVWRRVKENLQLMSRLADISEWRAKHKSKR